MNRIATFLVLILLTSCGNNNSKQKVFSDATVLSIDNDLLKRYEDALKTDTVLYEKNFIKDLLGIIHRFNGRALDTTLLLIDNLDGEGSLDTIYSRVHLSSDNVFVDSWWVQNKDTLWHNSFKNPFSSLPNAVVFDSERKNPWVTFTIGVLQSVPEFYTISKFGSGADVPRQMILGLGVGDLEKKGIHISFEEYDNYLKTFKGTLLIFGEPMDREGLYVWYKPAKCFITYYHA